MRLKCRTTRLISSSTERGSDMKRKRRFVKDYFKPFIRDHICVAIFSVLFFAVYRNVSGLLPTILFIGFVILYTTSIAICEFGMSKFEGYERSGTLTRKRLYRLSFLIGTPVYLLWFAYSFIPIAHYVVWILTGLPLCVVSALNLFEVADRWHQRKILFWSIQATIYLVLTFIGQWTIHRLFF